MSPSETPSGKPNNSRPTLKQGHAISEEMAQAHSRNQLRRQIAAAFDLMAETSLTCDSGAIAGFLVPYQDSLNLVREALARYRLSQDAWSSAVHSWLAHSDAEISACISRIHDYPHHAVDPDAIVRAAEVLQQGIRVLVPTTVRGPSWSSVTASEILSEINRTLGGTSLEVLIDEEVLNWRRTGDYTVAVSIEGVKTVPVRVAVALDLDTPPGNVSKAWNGVDVIEVDPTKPVLDALWEYLESQSPVVGETIATLSVLKAAYYAGYWKHEWVQGVLDRWQFLVERVSGEDSVDEDGDSLGGSRLYRFPVTERAGSELVDKVLFGLVDTEETRRLRILDLPPLVAYDLVAARVDMSVLEPLFVSKDLAHRVGCDPADLAEHEIKRLALGINDDIYALRYRRGAPLGPKALADILLSAARLQFDRLQIGTGDDSIRFCLSAYSTRMGEYLVQEHHRYDVARDYYLEAISLNLVSLRGMDFPTNLLFLSFFPGASLRVSSHEPQDFLDLFTSPPYRTDHVLETAVRCFLELGARHINWATRWFEACPRDAKGQMLDLIRKHLDLSPDSDFTIGVDAYVQSMTRFNSLLMQMARCASEHSIAETGPEFARQLNDLGLLVSPTNREISERLIRASNLASESLTQTQYEYRRNYSQSTLTLLDQVSAYQYDNRTALWATYFRPIAYQWHKVISQSKEAMAQDVMPKIHLRLAEPSLSLTDTRLNGGHPRVIISLENTGGGTADRLNVRLSSEAGQSHGLVGRDMKLEPGEVRETYVDLGQSAVETCRVFDYIVTYYDPDRNFVQLFSEAPIKVGPVVRNADLDNLRNPFNPGPEVTNERMFVGRDRKLQEVTQAAEEGGLLMLHGQKRVGKSSFLIFLERRLDSMIHESPLLPVRVQWTGYTRHSAAMVMEEIALAIQHKLCSRFDQLLRLPDRAEFTASYTFAFNNVLRNLEAAGVLRLVLMIDEFDAIAHHQLERVELGFDRSFFEYLRGLSKRPDVTLILTGGEMMPIVFERLGDVFNHNRPWRIDYLSRTDGSVERLVRNDYVREVLTVSDEAVEMIKEVSACNPFFVQMICKEMVEAARRQYSSLVCQLDVEETVEWLVHRGGLDNKAVMHLYSPFTTPDPLDMVIIGLVSELEMSERRPQFVTQESIIQRIDPRHHDMAITRIGELVRREVLRRNPKDSREIRIMLPLFRDWFNDNKPEYRLWAPLLKR